jgi:predicted nucleic acid-binding protein
MPSARVVVADTGSLIALSRVGGLGLLADLFTRALPDRPEGADIRTALDAGWLIRAPDPANPTDWGLDAGESSAISLALTEGAGLLVDDHSARRVTTALGILVIGVLGVLVLARRRSAIPAIRPLIAQLVESDYFLAAQVIEDALRLAGEGALADPEGKGGQGKSGGC